MLVVVDDFLTNAAATRAYAAGLDFTVTGNFPGGRTHGHADAAWVPILEKYTAGERVTWFDTHPLSYNGSFQLALASDGDSWVHADATDWAAVLFLGPPDAPAAAGLTLFRHRASGLLADDGSRDARRALAEDARDPAKWEPAATVANVFNRLVLFRGRCFHKSSAYFGDRAANGRLFQVLFFNTTSPPLERFRLAGLPRVLVLVFSTNRYEYLARTLAALRARVDFAGVRPHVRVVDDWPAGRDAARARELYRVHGVDETIEHETNLGLGATWREAWARIAGESFDWVLHLEDDAVFERPVRVLDVARAYAAAPEPLSQVFFKRQVCYDASHDFIAEIESGRAGADREGPIGVTDQRRYFVAMASLYPKLVVQAFVRSGSALDPHEHTLRAFFGRLGMWSAMWGARDAPPTVRHVGEVSRGRKVSPGDPDAARFARLPTDADYRFDTGEKIIHQTAKTT